ncbi:MAG: KH domain-containing protein [Verrucomicrobiales bacterium]
MDAAAAIQEFTEFVIGALIDSPEQATINRRFDEVRNTLHFDVTLAESDLGRIIGKNGFVISSIRSLLDAAGEKNGCRVRFKLHTLATDGSSHAVDEARQRRH